ncbi:hypothetical protein [Roseibium aggregatum]|uniref:Uncharacterized protein n=1 Tax=Roseibium aggregatum TaxID=187304 RepID=A0A926S3Z1_9HYPH|nr:hypothetical protein [Roseibium aggregatum]MBD1544851.1 hypothetical protein [Roseibium aggregatum]
MDIVGHCLRFEYLYLGDRALTPHELLLAELKAAEEAGVRTLAEVICTHLFGHSDPSQISDDDVERFVSFLDPIIMAALSGQQPRQ